MGSIGTRVIRGSESCHGLLSWLWFAGPYRSIYLTLKCSYPHLHITSAKRDKVCIASTAIVLQSFEKHGPVIASTKAGGDEHGFCKVIALQMT